MSSRLYEVILGRESTNQITAFALVYMQVYDSTNSACYEFIRSHVWTFHKHFHAMICLSIMFQKALMHTSTILFDFILL
jgi:hypothetical protein